MIILDVRVPSVPVARLCNHRAQINGITWAPHSSCHICTAGKDAWKGGGEGREGRGEKRDGRGEEKREGRGRGEEGGEGERRRGKGEGEEKREGKRMGKREGRGRGDEGGICTIGLFPKVKMEKVWMWKLCGV